MNINTTKTALTHIINRIITRKYLTKLTQKRFKTNDCVERDCCGKPLRKPEFKSYVIEKSCEKCNYYTDWRPKVPNLQYCEPENLQQEKQTPKKCCAAMNQVKKVTRCDIEREVRERFKMNDPKSVHSCPKPKPKVPKSNSQYMNCKGCSGGKKKCRKPIPAPDWDCDK